jgi:hypothetical protein
VADLDLSARKPLKRYDRRSITSAENGRRAWGKNLETQMVSLADSTKDERLRFEILKYLCDRVEGKPFTAINPDERKGRAMIQGNRLQLAIQQLIMTPAQPAPDVPRQPQSVQSKLPETPSGAPADVDDLAGN